MAALTYTTAEGAAERTGLLRRALQVDAVLSGASAAALLIGAAPLAELTGIPAGYLTAVGAVFLPWTAFLAYLSTRPAISLRAALVVAVLNALWVVDTVVILATGWLPLTAAGFWLLVAQAVLVDLIAGAQYLGVRRARRA